MYFPVLYWSGCCSFIEQTDILHMLLVQNHAVNLTDTISSLHCHRASTGCSAAAASSSGKWLSQECRLAHMVCSGNSPTWCNTMGQLCSPGPWATHIQSIGTLPLSCRGAVALALEIKAVDRNGWWTPMSVSHGGRETETQSTHLQTLDTSVLTIPSHVTCNVKMAQLMLYCSLAHIFLHHSASLDRWTESSVLIPRVRIEPPVRPDRGSLIAS